MSKILEEVDRKAPVIRLRIASLILTEFLEDTYYLFAGR